MKPRRHSFGTLLFCLAMSIPQIQAQTLPDTGITILHAGRLFDSEKGNVSTNVDVKISQKRIEAIGSNIPVPAGAREIDLRDAMVLPGLIDCHTHLMYLEDPSRDQIMESPKAIIQEGEVLRALHGAARARTFLLAGITTVRDLGNCGQFGDVALRTAINDRSVDGP